MPPPHATLSDPPPARPALLRRGARPCAPPAACPAACGGTGWAGSTRPRPGHPRTTSREGQGPALEQPWPEAALGLRAPGRHADWTSQAAGRPGCVHPPHGPATPRSSAAALHHGRWVDDQPLLPRPPRGSPQKPGRPQGACSGARRKPASASNRPAATNHVAEDVAQPAPRLAGRQRHLTRTPARHTQGCDRTSAQPPSLVTTFASIADQGRLRRAV
jgi:hypothetical protein